MLEQLADGRLMVALTQREFPSHNSKGRLRLFLAAADGEHWEETTDSSLAPVWPGATGKFRCQLNGDKWLDIGAGGPGGHDLGHHSDEQGDDVGDLVSGVGEKGQG